MQIQVWALFLGEVILAEVSCSYFFFFKASLSVQSELQLVHLVMIFWLKLY